MQNIACQIDDFYYSLPLNYVFILWTILYAVKLWFFFKLESTLDKLCFFLLRNMRAKLHFSYSKLYTSNCMFYGLPSSFRCLALLLWRSPFLSTFLSSLFLFLLAYPTENTQIRIGKCHIAIDYGQFEMMVYHQQNRENVRIPFDNQSIFYVRSSSTNPNHGWPVRL